MSDMVIFDQIVQQQQEIIKLKDELAEANERLIHAEKMIGTVAINHSLELTKELAIQALKQRAEDAESKLSRYEQGIEVEGLICAFSGNLNCIYQPNGDTLDKLKRGQRVKVLVMKEG